MDDLVKEAREAVPATQDMQDTARGDLLERLATRIEADAARIRELEAFVEAVGKARYPVPATLSSEARALLARMGGEHDRS